MMNVNDATSPNITKTERTEDHSPSQDKNDNRIPNVSDENNKPKLHKASRSSSRKRSVYLTDDLVREKSPDPTINADAGDLVTESATKLVNGKRQVQCNICKRHMTESRLANHIRLMHVERVVNDSGQGNSSENNGKDTPSRPWKCDHCGKSYAIKYTWQQHVRTHIEGRPKCPDCGDTFATAFGLFRHRVRNHNLEHNFKTFTCNDCSKGFFSVSELTLHQQRHSTNKDFVCTECKKGFSVKGNLRIHMRTHAKEKLYKCDICLGSFSHPYSLVSHRRIHTNDFPYKCDVCQKFYRSKHQLTSHQNVHTENRPFKCIKCPKTFRSRTAFKMHQDEHEGIKRFTCQYCSRKFQCHGNKLKHERRHEGIKRHKCDTCEKAFIEKQELKNHQKVHLRRNQAANQNKPDEND